MKKIIFSLLVAMVATVWNTNAQVQTGDTPAQRITVGLKASSLPDDWGSQVALYAWATNPNVYPLGSFPGTVLTEEKGWYIYTFDSSITKISIVWSDNKTNNKQTSSIKDITSSTYYEISGGSNKAYQVTEVEGPAPSTDPEILTLTPAPATSEVGQTVTFSVTTNNFSATPVVVYSVKAEEGEYETLPGNTYSATTAGTYTVKAVATNGEETAEKTAQFTVKPAVATTVVQIKLPSDWTEPAIYSVGGEHSGVAAMTQGEAEGELTWWSGKVYADFNLFLFKNAADKTTWDLQTTNITEIPETHTCYTLTGAQESGKYVVAVTATSVALTVGSFGYATIVTPYNLTVPSGVQVFGYTLDDFSGALIPADAITEGEILPANKGYIVKAVQNEYIFTPATAAAGTAAKFESDLTGWTTDKAASEAGGTVYGLGIVSEKVGFYKFSGATIPAGKAVYVKPEN